MIITILILIMTLYYLFRTTGTRVLLALYWIKIYIVGRHIK